MYRWISLPARLPRIVSHAINWSRYVSLIQSKPCSSSDVFLLKHEYPLFLAEQTYHAFQKVKIYFTKFISPWMISNFFDLEPNAYRKIMLLEIEWISTTWWLLGHLSFSLQKTTVNMNWLALAHFGYWGILNWILIEPEMAESFSQALDFLYITARYL